MTPEDDARIGRILREGVEIDRAVARAVREAIIRHKKLGEAIVVMEDGKIKVLRGDEIVIPPEP